GFPVAEAQEQNSSGKKQDARTRFIEQFLKQGQQGRLAGLVLGQLDAFNRIATTFGHEQCDLFCADFTDRLRETLPARTPILRLSERRFALLVDCDSMSAVMDIAVALTEQNPPQLTVGGDQFAVDIYRPDATQQQAALWKFETELQSAVSKGQLEVYYQPKVEIATNRVCG